MPIYSFECLTCSKKFDSIVKVGEKITPCESCGKIAERIRGQDVPAPALICAGCGGVDKPRFGERKY